MGDTIGVVVPITLCVGVAAGVVDCVPIGVADCVGTRDADGVGEPDWLDRTYLLDAELDGEGIADADKEGAFGLPTIAMRTAAPSRVISVVPGVAPQNCPIGPFCVTTAHCGAGAGPHGIVTLQRYTPSEVQEDVRSPM